MVSEIFLLRTHSDKDNEPGFISTENSLIIKTKEIIRIIRKDQIAGAVQTKQTKLEPQYLSGTVKRTKMIAFSFFSPILLQLEGVVSPRVAIKCKVALDYREIYYPCFKDIPVVIDLVHSLTENPKNLLDAPMKICFTKMHHPLNSH